MHPRGHGAVVAGMIAAMTLAIFMVLSAAQTARAIWLTASLAMFIAGIAALVRYRARKNQDISIPVLMLMMLAPAVFSSLGSGGVSLIVFALVALTAVTLLKDRDRLVRLAPVAITVLVAAIALKTLIDPGIGWTRQTALGVLATAVTVLAAWRSPNAEAWIAAGATLSVLAQLAVAEPHFVLMAIPLALLRLTTLEIFVVGALLIVPLEYTAERFTTGWWALLAHPRLYAAWFLWAASMRELRYHAPTQEAGNGIFTSRVRS